MIQSDLTAVSVSSRDIEGGAARAAYRLHQGLRGIGVNSLMLVQRKHGNDTDILQAGGNSPLAKSWNMLKPWLDLRPLGFYPRKQSTPWSCNLLPSPYFGSQLNALSPDIVHVHWIGEGFVSPARLAAISKPVVWTLHDMWAFTGGCHYDDGCGRYSSVCCKCPQLGSKSRYDLSTWLFHRKIHSWKNWRPTLICPSKWLAHCACRSAVFGGHDIRVIPNGLDTHRFQPLDKQFCRKILGLPDDAWIVLFGAMLATSDRKKGFHLLEPALKKLSNLFQGNRRIELLIFGAFRPDPAPDFGFPDHYAGRFHDDVSLAVAYSAGDVMIAPSIQDNLPSTVMEALACGTPVVAFDIGGIPDMIEHQRNGYLARAFDTENLAMGIRWILENEERRLELSRQARSRAVEKYALPTIARRHVQLYQELLEERKPALMAK